MSDVCPAERLSEALRLAGDDTELGLSSIEGLIADHGADARLHFLKGSLLASLQRYEEAHAAMGHAVEMAPDYDLARFQLGLLELSSGRPELAENTLAPLEQRADKEPLRLFGEGLRHLIRDDLAGAVARLREGIAHNVENPALNRDMTMLIAEAERGLAERGDASTAVSQAQPEAEVTSQAERLLQQFGHKPTRH